MPNKHNSMVFYSSTLEMPHVHKNWSSVPLIAFFDKKDQQRMTAMPKNIFQDTSTMVGTHNWHVWVKHAKHKVWLSIYSSLLANN